MTSRWRRKFSLAANDVTRPWCSLQQLLYNSCLDPILLLYKLRADLLELYDIIMTLCNIDLYWLLSIFYVISCFDWHIGWKGAMEPAFCRIIWKELSFWPGATSRNSKSFVWKFTVGHVGDAVASWLVRSSPKRAVRVRALAGDTVLCSWARHSTLTVPLSIQEYKWVPANCWGKPNKLRGNGLRWTVQGE